MKDTLKQITDTVFSFGAFVTIMCFVFGYALTMALINENEEQEISKATTKACYNNAMIKVETDAGPYCVTPANLVKVK